MKKTLILLVSAMSVFSPGVAEEVKELKVASKTAQVTVFLNGAELRHDANVTLKQGKNLVKFTGLSSKLDPSSIVVDISNKNMVILSVYNTTNFLAPLADNPRVKPLKDSIEQAEDRLAIIKGMIETYTREKELLYKNDAILGKDKGTPVEEILKSADFFRKRMNEINTELNRVGKTERKLKEKIQLLEMQLDELNAEINPPSSEISVLVLAGESAAAEFELKYRVADAGWAPKYDIRVDGVNKPVNLYYKANVFNNTGVDWLDVKLKLSTADPRQGAQRPVLDQWTLDGSGNKPNLSTTQKAQIDQLKKQNAGVDFKTVEVDELSAEFEIKQAYTVPSDSKPYLVDVTFRALEAKYEYQSVPKMDKDAFLIAKAVGWADLNLVSGNASIYFNGSYIGQSRINIVEISDTLELSLGRDSKVAISRVKKSERNEHQIIGNFEKEVFRYDITVRNNREVPLTMTIMDQVPVENDSRVDVSLSELSGGFYNKFNGEVSWALTLQPGETRKLEFNFSARYPKEFMPHKRMFRTVSCPSF